MLTSARAQLQVKRPPIYTFYRDRKQPPRSQMDTEVGAYYGGDTPHSTDIAYVFEALETQGLDSEPEDAAMSNAMMTYWANSARNGGPNGVGLALWPVYMAQTP